MSAHRPSTRLRLLHIRKIRSPEPRLKPDLYSPFPLPPLEAASVSSPVAHASMLYNINIYIYMCIYEQQAGAKNVSTIGLCPRLEYVKRPGPPSG